MGLFCANLHLRSGDSDAVSAALRRRGVSQYRVTAAKNGWTSLYEARASQQDDDWIRELAGGLSRDLGVAVVAFLVHDSDIARYWLYEKGRLLDEYDSCPDYFDADGAEEEPAGPAGGQPDVLLRFCRQGVRREDLAATLGGDRAFAEGVIEEIADALGIEVERALGDYRDLDDRHGREGPDGPDEDDDGGGDAGPQLPLQRSALAGLLGRMFHSPAKGADPRARALVEAAARDDIESIYRLLAAGAAIEAEAPAPLPGEPVTAGLAQLLPGGVPPVAMAPLLAAVVHKRRSAARRLLAAGADPNKAHPLFGAPVHAATAAGDVEFLRLLLDRGGNINARNAQGLTPLQVLAASRESHARLGQAQELLRTMGMKLPAIAEQLSNVALPFEGWDACEQLLRARGAR